MITTILKNIEIQAFSCIQNKYVFIKLNTVDTSYTSRYSAFNKGEHQYIADKINCINTDNDSELNNLRKLMYYYILENNINASIDPTNEEEEIKNKTV